MSFYPLRFQNDSGDTAPGYGVMFVSGVARGDSNQFVYRIEKPAIPSDIPGEKIVLVNSGQPVADQEYGWARYASTIGPVLFDDAETTSFGDLWGPATNSWKLTKDKGGFQVLGNDDATNDLTYAKLLADEPFHGVTAETIGAASNGKTGAAVGDVTLWLPDSGGDLADGPAIEATNRSLDSSLASGTYVQVQWSWRYLEWMIVWADC